MESVLIVACFDLLFTETVPMSPKFDYQSWGYQEGLLKWEDNGSVTEC